ncbi:MAG TPA: hypothetical protein VGL72_21495, partial [Bryobacteraceae bacterium]
MIRFFVLCWALFTAFTCYSQRVVIPPSTIAGILLIGPQAPNFTPAVARVLGSDQPPAFLAWLPYGVVIQNNSSQALAAICVAWTGTFSTKATATAIGCEDGFNRPLHQITPGQSVVAMPRGILLRATDLRPYSRGAGLGNLSNWQRAESIAVSVDSLVFASGQFVGSDTAGEYEKFKAQLAVPQSVAATLLQKKETDTISDVIKWLQSLDAQSRQRFDDYNVHQSGVTARAILGIYRNKG